MRVELEALAGVDRREMLWAWLQVHDENEADAFVNEYLEPPAGARADLVAFVAREADTLRSCIHLYGMLRSAESGEVSAHEVRLQLAAEQLRWRRQYNSRDFSGPPDYRDRRELGATDDETYLEEHGLFLRNFVNSKIGNSRLRLGHRPGLPAGYSWAVRGDDFVADAYLLIAGMMVEREPVAVCKACGRVLGRGRRRFCSDRCGAKARQRRHRTHTSTHKPVGTGGIPGTPVDSD